MFLEIYEKVITIERDICLAINNDYTVYAIDYTVYAIRMAINWIKQSSWTSLQRFENVFWISKTMDDENIYVSSLSELQLIV